MSKIKIENIIKIFGNREKEALKLLESGKSKEQILHETGCSVGINRINLEIKENELFVIMGLSGSGKSTLIRHINGLIEPTAGSITIDGRDVSHLPMRELINLRRYKVSMVFQKFGLMPHRTIIENVRFGLALRGEEKKKSLEKSENWIQKVGLNGYQNSYPRHLSGGMQQRVGIARALAVESDIVLMDEPFSALDPLIRAEMQDITLKLRKDISKTIVFVTHDINEATKLADRMAILKDGEVMQIGTPEEIKRNPSNDYVKKFIEASL